MPIRAFLFLDTSSSSSCTARPLPKLPQTSPQSIPPPKWCNDDLLARMPACMAGLLHLSFKHRNQPRSKMVLQNGTLLRNGTYCRYVSAASLCCPAQIQGSTALTGAHGGANR